MHDRNAAVSQLYPHAHHIKRQSFQLRALLLKTILLLKFVSHKEITFVIVNLIYTDVALSIIARFEE